MKNDTFSHKSLLKRDEIPQLSIITINLNNRDGLENTIKSVINQTFGNFEYIVIDGGSTDGSADLIERYSNKISYRISEKDSGIYNAMNKGIKKATGEYCLFLNSGDTLFDENILSKIFSNSKDWREDILYGNMMIDYLNGTRSLGKMPSKLTFKHMILDTLWHPVSFIKRTLFEKTGLYNEQFSIAGDYDFFLKTVIVEKVTTHYLNQTIAVFTLDGLSSMPSNKLKLMSERKKIQLQYFDENIINSAMKITFVEKIKQQIKRWMK